MKIKQLAGIVLSLSVLMFAVFCDNTGLNIELTADAPSLAPGASTVLHCDVEDDGVQLEYAWSADTGTVENLGDSAVWTAPDDFTWNSYSAVVTVTVDNNAGNVESESITLQIAVTRSDVEATDDAYTFGHEPDSTHADEVEMLVGYSDEWDAFFRGFLRFPTPQIPEGDTVRNARIKLTREWGYEDDCQIDIYLITEDWQGSQLTRNNEPESSNWATITDNSSDKGVMYIGVGGSLIEDWLNGSRDNYGFMLRLADESGSDHAFRSYVTVDDPDAAEHPTLEVVSW